MAEKLELITVPKEVLYREHKSTRFACYALAVVCCLTAIVNIGTSTNSQNTYQTKVDAMVQMWGIVLEGSDDPNDDLVKKLKEIYYSKVNPDGTRNRRNHNAVPNNR